MVAVFLLDSNEGTHFFYIDASDLHLAMAYVDERCCPLLEAINDLGITTFDEGEGIETSDVLCLADAF